MSGRLRACGWVLGSSLLAGACQKAPPPKPTPAASGAEPRAASSSRAVEGGLSSEEFAGLFRDLSEPDRYFFSDNHVSNETSYLEVAPILERLRKKGGAYLGVGPEQNFAYIALLEPEISFIVDIRRDNALLHLLYKSCFAEATSRAHFLALLLGRELPPGGAQGAEAELAGVLTRVDQAPRDAAAFAAIHRRLVSRIAEGVPLTDKDRERLDLEHRAFFEAGLGIRFELHQTSQRNYPTLRELLSATDPFGQPRGFLASEQAFRTIQRLHRQNRIVPVVGDFAGPHALKAIAKELGDRRLEVAAFYVSNVEQYLLTGPQWKAWTANVDALPQAPDSVFIRAYLDQGQRHPRQQPGQRSVTIAQALGRFPSGSRPPSSYYQITTAAVLEP